MSFGSKPDTPYIAPVNYLSNSKKPSMENFEKLMKAFHRVTGQPITINYNGEAFRTIVGDDKSPLSYPTYQEMIVGVKELMISKIMNLDVNLVADSKPQIEVLVKKQVKRDLRKSSDTKTRHEWSLGKQGDPRKSDGRGRKRKRKSFSKTQIVQFMRRTSNFTSELVTYAQYCEEFMHENRKAENRQWWRANRGKGLANYDVTKLHRSVQK